MYRTRISAYTSLLLIGVFLLTACQSGGAPVPTIFSPLSPIVTPSSVSAVGQVYAAQIRGAWAAGGPYPVFFFDVPTGTTRISAQRIAYGTQPPLSGAHPRLTELSQAIVWPGGVTSQVLAQDFVYDENAGLLLMFNAFLDGSSLDTASYDIFSCAGVGIAYLGDAGGANVFYNCAVPISIQYQELSRNETGRPTEALFTWECESNAYEVNVTMTWGKSDPVYNIDVITGLTAAITRE